MFDYLYKNSKCNMIVQNDLANAMLNHAYLIVCEDSCKASDFALSIASTILCESEEKPCFNCVICNKVAHGTHADVLTFPSGKALTVDEAKMIANECIILPVENDKKIIIINNLDLARTDAQNKLLKTLEEPSKSVVFIITASNEQGVLPTIRSRVKLIVEKNEDASELKNQLELIPRYKSSLNESLLEASDGNIAKLNEFLSNKKSNEIFEFCFDLLKNYKKSGQTLEYSYKLLELKDNLKLFFAMFELVLRDVLVCEVNSENVVNKSRIQDLKIISKDFSEEVIYKLILKLVEVNEKLKFNCNSTCVVDNFLLYMLEVLYICRKN